jgi:hypothetical protein
MAGIQFHPKNQSNSKPFKLAERQGSQQRDLPHHNPQSHQMYFCHPERSEGPAALRKPLLMYFD